MTDLTGINTILFDGDGVLWKAEDPIVGIQPLFAYLTKRGSTGHY